MTLAISRSGLALAVLLVVCASGLAVAQTVGPPAGEGQQATAPGKRPARKAVAKADGEAARPSPEVADRLLESAHKALVAGKTETAMHQLTRIIGTSGLGTPVMARALYLRGLAFRKQGKPAQAISDLTSSIWLKGGLNDTDRADALQQRIAAYRDAGLSDPGLAEPNHQAAAPAKAAHTAGVAAPVAGPVMGAAPDAPAPQPQQSGGFFSSLFGGASSQGQAAAPPPPPPVTSAVAPQTGSAWSSQTEVAPATQGGKAAHAKAKHGAATASKGHAAPHVAPGKAVGGHLKIQVASVKTREEAEALAARIRREHAALLGARQTEIDSANIGAFGTLFRVRIGPFAAAEESRELCQRLKSTGLDCMVVTR